MRLRSRLGSIGFEACLGTNRRSMVVQMTCARRMYFSPGQFVETIMDVYNKIITGGDETLGL